MAFSSDNDTRATDSLHVYNAELAEVRPGGTRDNH
jgi:hypothetical protein